MGYNYCAQSITKHISAVARTVVNISQVVIIWVGGIIVTKLSKTDSFHWESLDWRTILLELFGFILIIIGNLIFNSILKFAFL